MDDHVRNSPGARKRKWGDRYDGRLVRTLDPIMRMVPYIMKDRNSSQNFFKATVDIAEAERYILKKRAEGMPGFGMLHVFIAAYIRLVSQRPAINRFVSGQKVYSRGDVIVSLAIKKRMTEGGAESLLKMHFGKTDTIDDVYVRLRENIGKARADNDNGTDFAARLFSRIPGLLLKFVIWKIELLDYFGLLPRWINEASPFHGSLFITDIGSLGIPVIYHHLYNFGNIPVFMSFGMKRTENRIEKNGEVKSRRVMDISLVTDERICDGYYYARCLKEMLELLKNPERLDSAPAGVTEDID